MCERWDRLGYWYPVITEVIWKTMPKWRARQETVSPSFMTSLLAPPIAFSQMQRTGQ
jgi:hypothetical protein